MPDENHTPFNPKLQTDGSCIGLELTDHIIQNKLFNFFLLCGCAVYVNHLEPPAQIIDFYF